MSDIVEYYKSWADGTSSVTDPSGDLTGFNLDTSVRFTSDELATLAQRLDKYFGESTVCIIGQCLGGALEDDDLHFWESTALTAQTYCKTDMTFNQAIAAVRERSPTLADFIVAKRAAAKNATMKHYEKQAEQDRAAVYDAAAEGAKKVAETVGNTLNIAPAAGAVGIVVALAVVAVVLARKAS